MKLDRVILQHQDVIQFSVSIPQAEIINMKHKDDEDDDDNEQVSIPQAEIINMKPKGFEVKSSSLPTFQFRKRKSLI